MKKKILWILLLGIVLTGCFYNDHISTYIEEYFQTNEDVIYNEPMTAVSPDHVFSFRIDQSVYWDITEFSGYGLEDIFTVFTDVGLTKRIPTSTTFEHDTLMVAPGQDSRYFVEGNARFSGGNNWGYFSHYYLVQNFDLYTGERLQFPLVTAFTVDRALIRPVLTVDHEIDGSFTLSWESVPNAASYYLIRIDFSGREHDYEVHVIATTTNTSWNSDVDGSHIENVNVEMFGQYITSRDQQFASEMIFWWEDEGAFSLGSIFGVAARGGHGFSNLSFFHESKIKHDTLICEAAPYAIAEIIPDLEIETASEIPALLPVTACSGSTINAQVILDIDNLWWEDELLHVPFGFNHSNLSDYFTIIMPDFTNYREDLFMRQAEMEQIFTQSSLLDYRYQNSKVIAFDVRSSSTLPEIHDTVFSTSELEEFIAANMIDGAAKIDISQFHAEDRSPDTIFDLLHQIRYQNPMILQHHGLRYDYENKLIFIHYFYDPETRADIQQMIREEVSMIANEIISSDMSDVEKVIAINQYIVDHTVYDDDAYESLRYIGPGFLLEEFLHASTAGGVFLQGYAICEGLTAAFMLLTDYVGIRSIAVTGHTTKDPGRHMWNRVLIGDQWYIVDVTYNDDEHVPNSALLLADDLADEFYFEDEFFLIDSKLKDYRAPGASIHEYYYLRGLIANDTSEALEILIQQLQTGTAATVRVPIDTTEEQIEQIAQSLANLFQRGVVFYQLNSVIRIMFQ